MIVNKDSLMEFYNINKLEASDPILNIILKYVDIKLMHFKKTNNYYLEFDIPDDNFGIFEINEKDGSKIKEIIDN